MSGRLLRKVLKERDDLLLLDPNPKPESENHSEPDSPASAAPSKNPFNLLDESTDAISDEDTQDTSGDSNDKVIQQEHLVKGTSYVSSVSNRKPKKNKKKNEDGTICAKVRSEESIDSILADLSINTKASSVKSQNNVVEPTTRRQSKSPVLLVDPKHLKAENELRRIFGSKVVNSFENNRSAGSSRQMHGVRGIVTHVPRKTIIVSASNHWPRWDGTLSMELLEIKDGTHYFRYVHSASYHHAQQAFEAAKSINDINAIANILQHYPYHIDSLLTFAELFKYSGEHQQSADAISKCLYALECAWHPLFNPLRGNCQLKFTHDTNKPLFTALFSHMKNMDRRGCHRSALEVCKLLYSLDFDDPKGALFCIDYFALRAQEYTWLEDFAEEYGSDTSLWLFPNFSYSLAVTRFYIESETGLETEKSMSVDLMKQALLLHPLVLRKLVEKAPLKDLVWSQILKNSFFGSAKAGSPTFEHLIDIYVERSYLIWRFPELQTLLKEAALQVIDLLKQNGSELKDWACARKEAFPSEKNEYSHLMTSDFSDTAPSLPPEELQQFMVGQQQMVPGAHGDAAAVQPERAATAPTPRQLAGRHPAIVFLESLLPWINYGNLGTLSLHEPFEPFNASQLSLSPRANHRVMASASESYKDMDDELELEELGIPHARFKRSKKLYHGRILV